MIEPDNSVIKERLMELRDLKSTGHPTVPSTIGHEKKTNVFLRAHTPEIKYALKMVDAPDVDVFAELRRRKDVF